MSKLTALKSAKTLHDVATLLGFKPSSLSYVLHIKSPEKKYQKFEIQKRYGGTRQICAPLNDLKLLQRRLADLLEDCILEINQIHGRSDTDKHPDRVAHGFKRGRSIITNAKQHNSRRYVFNIDLEKFFDTINFGRVRGYFIKDKNFLLDQKVATILAQIACFESKLPQGSPCSPVISNLIAHILDMHLVKLAKRNGCIYSRYADDLTFSSNKPNFPSQIASQDEKNEHLWMPGNELTRLIKVSGFEINTQKTRMQYKDSRQEVTGLIVNRKVNIRSEYRHTVRAMVYRLFTTGGFDFEQNKKGENGTATLSKTPGSLSQLHGMLGFIDGVDLFNQSINPREKGSPITSKERMYRRFLMFKEFYTSQMPVIICEGKTDNIYLTHAIRSLAKQYPTLATTDATGKIAINFRRFKYTGTSTGRILGIYGGTGDLGNFILNYRSELARFKAPGMKHPIILLIDNDSGAQSIFSIVKQITGLKPNRSEAFIPITGNLYLMTTPLLSDSIESNIEDLFDQNIRNVLLDGKSFDPSNEYEQKTHYGKNDFAYKVVKPNADSIDFSSFKIIFDNLLSLIAYHANKNSTI